MALTDTYRRSLGLTGLVSLGVGGTIGSGIFVVPGIAAGIAGSSSLIAWVIVALSATCVMLSLAWFAGTRGYRESFYSLYAGVFGEKTSMMLVSLYIVSCIFGIGTIAAGIGQYISFFGVSGILVLELLVIGTFCAVNLAGIALSGTAEIALTVLKIVPLVVIAVLLLFFVSAGNLVPLAPVTASGMIAAILIVYWPFTGFEISAIPVDEVKDPGLIPRSLVLIMAIVASIYLLLNVSLIGSVGSAVLAASPAPVATASALLFSRSGDIVAVIGIIAMLSALNAYIVAGSRVLHTTASARGYSGMTGLNTRGAPVVPVIAVCIAGAVLLFFSNNFQLLAILSVVTTLVPYLFFCAGALLTGTTFIRRSVALAGVASTAAILLFSLLL